MASSCMLMTSEEDHKYMSGNGPSSLFVVWGALLLIQTVALRFTYEYSPYKELEPVDYAVVLQCVAQRLSCEYLDIII